MRQVDLFGDDQTNGNLGGKAAGLGMVRVPGAKETLSKAQLAFNRLVTRIEKLRRGIAERTTRLNGHLEFFVMELHPLELQIGNERKEMVRLLFPYLKGPSLGGRKSKARLREVVAEQLSGVIAVFGEITDDDLQAIFEEIEGISVKEAEAEDFEMMRDELGDMLESMGVDADLSGMRPGMSDAEIAAQMAQMKARMEESQEAARKKQQERPKTKRQLEREARDREVEEVRKKDVGGLYRQLAKLLHPDLEQDPVQRAEKEAAMKELTTAYKNSDLHGLLRLEVAWIAREQADASRLTDAKLAVYNRVLKEQVAELEEALAAVITHPRYHPLARYHDPFFGELRFDGPQERNQLRLTLNALRRSVTALRGPRGREEVRAILEDYVPRERRLPAWL